MLIILSVERGVFVKTRVTFMWASRADWLGLRTWIDKRKTIRKRENIIKELEPKYNNLSAEEIYTLACQYEFIHYEVGDQGYKKMTIREMKDKIISLHYEAVQKGNNNAFKALEHYAQECVDVKYLVGKCYEFGFSVNKNIKIAAECYMYAIKYVNTPDNDFDSDHLTSKEREMVKQKCIDRTLAIFESGELGIDEINAMMVSHYGSKTVVIFEPEELLGDRYNFVMQKLLDSSKDVISVAKTYISKGNSEKALSILDDFVSLPNSDQKIVLAAVEIYFSLNIKDKAFAILDRLEKSNNNSTEILMGIASAYREYGREVKAFEMYKKLYYEDNYVNAAYSLAYCYSNGIGTELNKEKAFEMYNVVGNDYELAKCYYYGIGTNRDYVKAIKHIKNTAYILFQEEPWYKQLKSDEMKLMYAECLYYGRGESINYGKVIDVLSRIPNWAFRIKVGNRKWAPTKLDRELLYLQGLAYYKQEDYYAAFISFEGAAYEIEDCSKAIPDAMLYVAEAFYLNRGLNAIYSYFDEEDRLKEAIRMAGWAVERGASGAEMALNIYKKRYEECKEEKLHPKPKAEDYTWTSSSYDSSYSGYTQTDDDFILDIASGCYGHPDTDFTIDVSDM